MVTGKFDNDIIFFKAAFLRAHAIKNPIQPHAFANGDAQCHSLFFSEVTGGDSHHGAIGNSQVQPGFEHRFEILQTVFPFLAEALCFPCPCGIIGNFVIHPNQRAGLFFGNSNSHLGRDGIDVRVPAKSYSFVFIQFQIMAAGVKISAPPKVHTTIGMRFDSGDIAQPFAQGG